MPGRLMVGQRPLKPFIGVRIPARQFESAQVSRETGAPGFKYIYENIDFNPER